MKLTREQVEGFDPRIFRQFSGLSVKGYKQPNEDELKALCDLALAALDTEWQDIASAPKDGTEIWICDDEQERGLVAFWNRQALMWWSAREGNPDSPSLWRPLPPPPQVKL